MATVKVPEHKVILCGEYGVGKSSLFRRYASDSFVEASDRRSTLGLDHFDRVYRTGARDVKLQLWDTGGMERVASITSSYYKFSDAAILVFSLDNPHSFHVLAQHLLDVVSYAEGASIFLCGNKSDRGREVQVTDEEMEEFSQQCHNLISGSYRTSCRTGEGVQEMFADIACKLACANRSRKELDAITENSFKVTPRQEERDGGCGC